MKRTLTLTLFGLLMLAAALLLVSLATPEAIAYQGAGMGPGGPGGPGPWAMGPGHGRGGGPGGFLNPRMFDRLAERLGLTEQQRDQIDALFEAHRTAVEPTHDQLQNLRQQFRELTAEGAFFANETEATDLALEIGQVEARLQVERARLQAQIYQVLTPEQREQLADLKNNFRHGRRGPGFEG